MSGLNLPSGIITFTGASGSGKSTIVRELLARDPNTEIVESITTRQPRAEDMPGEYRYVSHEELEDLTAKEKYVWKIDAHGNKYCTMVETLLRALDSDKTSFMILIPDVLRTLIDFAKSVDKTHLLRHLYVISPGPEVLRQRLAHRGDDDVKIESRINDCLAWDSNAFRPDIPYKYVANVHTLDQTIRQISKIFAQHRP